MLSTSLFAANGTRYPQSAVFGDTFTLNKTALAEIGLPALTGSNAWSNLLQNLAIGGLITLRFEDKSRHSPAKNASTSKHAYQYHGASSYFCIACQ